MTNTIGDIVSKEYLELLKLLKEDKDLQQMDKCASDNRFFNSNNGLFTIMLKPDGTYEVDYEFS